MRFDQTTARKAIHDSGLRMTAQKEAVIDVLTDNTSHPMAEDVARAVQEALPSVSLSTVYKALNELADLGLIQRLNLPGATRFDPDTSDHAHLLCRNCQMVVDVRLSERDLAPLQGAAAAAGAQVDGITVEYRGLCYDCLADLAVSTEDRPEF